MYTKNLRNDAGYFPRKHPKTQGTGGMRGQRRTRFATVGAGRSRNGVESEKGVVRGLEEVARDGDGMRYTVGGAEGEEGGARLRSTRPADSKSIK